MGFQEQPRPSRIFLRFFRWFCNRDMVDDIEGDLLERFEIRLRKHGKQRAKRSFVLDVLQLFRPGIIRSIKIKQGQKLNTLDMLKNYLKIARRTMFRQKMYSSIKIGGFALGIAACLLIGLYINEELSYDQHYSAKDRLFRIAKSQTFNGQSSRQSWMPAPFARTLLTDYPEVEMAGRATPGSLFSGGSNRLRPANEVRNSNESGFIFADSTILELFEIPMLYGDARTALSEASSVVLSKEKAAKFFPGKNPIGELMILDEREATPLKVTGVMDDIAGNSHFDFNYLVSLTGIEFFRGEQRSWGANNYQTYFRLKPNTDPKVLEAKLHDIADKYVQPFLERVGVANSQEFVDDLVYHMEAMPDIYLQTTNTRDPYEHGNAQFVLLFGIIAGLVLLIAIVNFINLSTAKSANRAMEVGLRKAIGSKKKDLIQQFLIESVLFSMLSFVLGVLISHLLLPYFNAMAARDLTIPVSEWWFVPGLPLAALVTGILAGVYPAFYLSSFKPIMVLKGSLSMGAKKSGFRGALVIFQFTVSIALIIATLVVGRQMNFIMQTEVGFDKEQVITLRGTSTLGDRVGTLKSELLNLSGVDHVTVSGFLPVSGSFRNSNLFWKEGRSKLDEGMGCQIWRVDHDYLSTLGVRLVEGRNFSKDMPTDSAAILVNEQMVKELGITDPLGKQVTNAVDNSRVFTIIGVLEDFHFESLKGKIEPLSLVLGNSDGMVSIKASSADMTGMVASIGQIWDRIVPEQSINYDFLDDRFAMMYEDVSRSGKIFTSFAVFAICVACLGLLGLSVFMIEQRNKEISIRLVLGAPVLHILKSLGINFLKPVLIAMAIAIPLAWFIMNDWLTDFEYKTALSWDIFILACSASLGIALLTVGYQSTRAALMKPVDGLRAE